MSWRTTTKKVTEHEALQILQGLLEDGLITPTEYEKKRKLLKVDSNSSIETEPLGDQWEKAAPDMLKQAGIDDPSTCSEFIAMGSAGGLEESRVLKLLKSIPKDSLVPILTQLVQYDLQRNRLGILREESFGATLLKHFWFSFEGKEYLQSLVAPLVKEILSITKSRPLEVNPQRLTTDPSLLPSTSSARHQSFSAPPGFIQFDASPELGRHSSDASLRSSRDSIDSSGTSGSTPSGTSQSTISPLTQSYTQIASDNMAIVLNLCQQFIRSFSNSVYTFPSAFKRILKTFYDLLTEIEGMGKAHLGLGFSDKALSIFGGFVLLRFICPALVSPQKYGLTRSEVPHNGSRALILVSKIIQNIGNHADFNGEKESYMIPANTFVQMHIPQFMSFFSSLTEDDIALTKVASSEEKKILRSSDEKVSTFSGLNIVDAPTQLPHLKIKGIKAKRTRLFEWEGPTGDILQSNWPLQVEDPKDKKAILGPCHVSCQTVSTYPFIQHVETQTMKRAGDPITDHVSVTVDKNFSCYVLADGCSWGLKIQLAASAATKAAVSHLNACAPSWKNLSDVGTSLLAAVSESHSAIIKSCQDPLDAGSTTLLGGAVLRVEGNRWGFLFFNLGNSKCYQLHYKTRKITDLTPLHGNQLQDRDPGGRIGVYKESVEPDLRNLKLNFAECEEGDLILLCSSGTHDNLDPVYLGLRPKDVDASLPSNDWEHYEPGMSRGSDARNRHRIDVLSTIASRIDDLNPDALASALEDYCIGLTEKTRFFMESNPSQPQPLDKRNFPGTFAHATSVAFRIGKPPHRQGFNALRLPKGKK